ncbi:MAG: uracil-DNA glycosylase [Alphaproteobacteria bacterium]|jgi:DNA polymerase|nr:uracil-DNA glycosylase [Alphaproteobacteria bacterium]
MPEISENKAFKALRDWWAEMGVEADTGLLRALETAPAPARTEAAPVRRKARPSLDARIEEARNLAAGAADLPALKAAIEAFDGCPLKEGARSTVVYDGVPGSAVMVIGEGPGAQEDATGKPFVGRAGQLLDRMLAAIGLSRQTNTLITNVNYWRPPGNRNPEKEELAVCRPFVDRMVELSAPKLIISAGNVPTQALTASRSGIMKLRGTEQAFTTSGGVTTALFPLFHPAFLLRRPQEKSRAWRDLLRIEQRLAELGGD